MSGGVAGTSGIMQSASVRSTSTAGRCRATVRSITRRRRSSCRRSSEPARTATPIESARRRTRRAGRSRSAFNTKTFDVEASNVSTFGTQHVVTYGANLPPQHASTCRSRPIAQNRTEGRRLRAGRESSSRTRSAWSVASVSIGSYIDQRRRVLAARRVPDARRTPTTRSASRTTARTARRRSINNFLDVTIAEPVDLSPFAVLNPALRIGKSTRCRSTSIGNANLKETSVDAYELGYTARSPAAARSSLPRSTCNQRTTTSCSPRSTRRRPVTPPANPPPGWPLPARRRSRSIPAGVAAIASSHT